MGMNSFKGIGLLRKIDEVFPYFTEHFELTKAPITDSSFDIEPHIKFKSDDLEKFEIVEFIGKWTLKAKYMPELKDIEKGMFIAYFTSNVQNLVALSNKDPMKLVGVHFAIAKSLKTGELRLVCVEQLNIGSIQLIEKEDTESVSISNNNSLKELTRILKIGNSYITLFEDVLQLDFISRKYSDKTGIFMLVHFRDNSSRENILLSEFEFDQAKVQLFTNKSIAYDANMDALERRRVEERAEQETEEKVRRIILKKCQAHFEELLLSNREQGQIIDFLENLPSVSDMLDDYPEMKELILK